MPEYPRSPFEKIGTSITPKVDGDAIDATVIGSTTPAAGSFTTMTVDTDLVVTEGDIDLVHTDKKLLLPQKNDAINPTLSFGDGNCGFYEQSDNIIAISLNGNAQWIFNSTGFISTNTLGALIKKAVGSATIPTYTFKDDIDTGIGRAAADALSFIAGGVEAHRITEATGSITHVLIDDVGITGDLDVDGTVQGDLLNNYMVQKAGFDVLGLMTDPRFLNLMCEDPEAGTMTDISGQGHNGTYGGSMATGDRIKKGMGWAVDFDGADDYVNLGDDDDFSFGDGTNDEAVTWFGVIEVVNTGGHQVVCGKWDVTTGSESREWFVVLTSDEKLKIFQYDESANVEIYKATSNALSVGYHTYAITSPGDGGATAMNNVKIYIDGEVVTCTSSNSGSYVAMENLVTHCWIGATKGSAGTPTNFFNGDSALLGIDGSAWSVIDVWRFHQLCRGLYGI